MKLYVDDERRAPEGWDQAYDAETAIRRIASMDYEEISLDHDAGDMGTFQPVAYFIAEKYKDEPTYPLTVNVHTANPAGRNALIGILNRHRLLVKQP